jgi:TRAP-type transport system periplasmic protein
MSIHCSKLLPKVLMSLLVNVVALGVMSAAAATRIDLATLAPRGSSPHQILQTMGEKWRKASNGSVTLNIFPDGVQGGEAAVVRRMNVGSLQAALLTAEGLGEIDKSISALEDMPMVFRTLNEAEYVRGKLRARIEKQFRSKGYVLLFWGDAGWVRFFSSQPIVSPADLRKMKLFTWAGNAEQEEIMKSAGWNPVPLETSLIYTSLKTGKIDAVPTIPLAANAGQYSGPCPYMLELNWAPLVAGAVVKADVWDALDPAARAALVKAAEEAGAELTTRTRSESDDAVEAMKKRGLKVTSVTPELEAAWRGFTEGFYPKIRGKIVPEAMFDEVQQLLKDFRASGQRSR